MKTPFVLTAFLSLVLSALGDEASSRKTAETILDVTNAAGSMKAGFSAMIDPMVANMKRQGMPDAAGAEITAAMSEWFDAEVKWTDIKPKMVEIYTKEFTEQELKDLLAFYQTPTGKQVVLKLPVVMRQGGVIGQQVIASKQASLEGRIKAIVDKYRGQPAPKPTP